MKKTIFSGCLFIAICVAAFFTLCFVMLSKHDENLRKNDFKGVYMPKEWKILEDKAAGDGKVYRIYSKDFFCAVMIIKKNIEFFDERELRKLVRSAQYMQKIRIDDYKIYYNKKMEGKIYISRFIIENDVFNNLVDVIVKKLDKTEVAVIYEKGGMYVKSNSSAKEPPDANVMEFVSKITEIKP